MHNQQQPHHYPPQHSSSNMPVPAPYNSGQLPPRPPMPQNLPFPQQSVRDPQQPASPYYPQPPNSQHYSQQPTYSQQPNQAPNYTQQPNQPMRPMMPMANLPHGQSHMHTQPSMPSQPAANIPHPSSTMMPQNMQNAPNMQNMQNTIQRQSQSNIIQHAQPSMQQRQSINPANIPSPMRIMEEEGGRFRDGPFFTSQVLARTMPPHSFADVQIIDDGMSSARFIRSTCWTLPISEELAEQTRIPMGLSIQPFAQLPSHEPAVPVLDFGARGPIRCMRCRGYISPYVTFVRGGRSWQCNLCGAVNEVPDDYYAALDAAGRRVDLNMRPELRCGTFDILAGPQYNLRPIVCQARLLVVIDASRSAVQSGAFKAAIETARSVFKSPDARELYSHFALATFDRSMHFYDLRSSLKEPQAIVMSDLNDPFLPVGPAAMFVPSAADVHIDRLLDGLIGLFSETRVLESCFGAAASVSLEALRSTGGRVFMFASSLPSAGPGGLKARAEGNFSFDKSNPLLTPQGDFYQRLAGQAAASGVSISLLLTPVSFIDIATVGMLTSHTGGTLTCYPRFNGDAYGEQMMEDALMTLTRPFVYDCVVRVRCGEGLQPGEYFGPCVPNAAGANPRPDVQFGALSCDQAFAVGLHYDGRLVENEPTGIQCAILHTTPAGQRRIRILNLALPTTKNPQDVFRTCDYEAIVSLITKQSLTKFYSLPMSQVMGAMFSRVSFVLAAYRKVAASNVASSQLILPEELRMLPLLLLSIVKNVAFSPATATVDARACAFRHLIDMPNDLLFHFLYPRLFSLLSLPDVAPSSQPPLLRLSRDSLDRQGVFLIENGMKMFIWVGDMVPAPVLSSIFGVPQLGSINPHMTIPRLPNSLSKSISTFIDSVKLRSLRSIGSSIVRQGIDQASEAELLQSWLLEDGSPAGVSYSDFLCKLHGQVQHDVGSISTSLLADKSALLSFFH